MKRLRVVGYLVQPQLLVDDGDNLTPLGVQPVSVSAADWPNVVEQVAGALTALRSEIEQPVEPADEPPLGA